MGLLVSPLFRPLLLCRVKWWENVAGGNTLFPGADISETGEFGRGPLKVPEAPVFDGT